MTATAPAAAGRGRVLAALALVALPVAAAAAAGTLAGRPLALVAAAGAALAALALAAAARRLGIHGAFVLSLALSILAGEVSAISLGGQSGRLLWADAVLGAGLAVALLRGGLTLAVPRTPVVTALLPWMAWCAATLLTARDPLTAIAELKEWIAAWLVLAAAAGWARDAARARALLWMVAAAGAGVALLMVVEAMRSPYGWVLAVLLKKVDLPWGRTNYLAGLLVLGLPLALGLLGGAAGWRPRAAAAALLAVQALGLALSASKGAILALVAGTLLAFAPALRAARGGAVTLLAVVGLGAALFLVGPLQQVLAYRLQASALEYSVGERVDLYELAWESFLKRPLTGVGLNNFSVVAHRLTGVDTVPHHLELGFLAETGIPGLLLAVGWLLAFGRAAWRARAPGLDPLRRAVGLGVWAAFLTFLLHNQIESTIYGQQYKFLLAIAAAAAAALAAPAPEAEGSCRMHDRRGAIVQS